MDVRFVEVGPKSEGSRETEAAAVALGVLEGGPEVPMYEPTPDILRRMADVADSHPHATLLVSMRGGLVGMVATKVTAPALKGDAARREFERLSRIASDRIFGSSGRDRGCAL